MRNKIPLNKIKNEYDSLLRFDGGEFLEWHREEDIRLLLWSSGTNLLDFIDKAERLFGPTNGGRDSRGGLIYDGIELCKGVDYQQLRTSSGEIEVVKNTHLHMDYGPERTAAWSAHPSDGDLAVGQKFAEVSLRFDMHDDRRKLAKMVSQTATNSIAKHALSIVTAVREEPSDMTQIRYI